MKSISLPSGRLVRQSALFTFLFALLAHAGRWLTMSTAGDAALISMHAEAQYQISIGRFLQPLYWQIRGEMNMPLVIGLFATAFVFLSAVMILDLLGIKSRTGVALACGILITCEPMICSYATYLPWVDVYMLALLFAVLGVYLTDRFARGWLISPLCYMISCGLYQSYIQAAAVLVIALLFLRLLEGEPVKQIWLYGIRACATLVAGLVLYYLAMKLSLSASGLDALDSYNSAANVGGIALADIPRLLISTYCYPLKFFLRPAGEAIVPAELNILFALCLLGMLALLARRLRPGAIGTLFFLVLILPLAANFVAFISEGIVHALMVFSFYMPHVLGLALYERLPAVQGETLWHRAARMARHACPALLAVMLAMNIAVGYTLYLRADLEYASTLSAITRILKEAESTEGYVPGETEVSIVGYLSSSAIAMERPGFEDTSNLQGIFYTYALPYESANVPYFRSTLGYPINLSTPEETRAYIAQGMTETLTPYPQDGYCQMIDGKLFIRLY